jgi:DNA (cytosine-5)-methyltransferase 1
MGTHDDWTAVPYRNKPAADGPRYKAIGNSMAVPVMRWIFNRLDFLDRTPQPTSPPPQ